jgi:hypothetical protein
MLFSVPIMYFLHPFVIDDNTRTVFYCRDNTFFVWKFSDSDGMLSFKRHDTSPMVKSEELFIHDRMLIVRSEKKLWIHDIETLQVTQCIPCNLTYPGCDIDNGVMTPWGVYVSCNIHENCNSDRHASLRCTDVKPSPTCEIQPELQDIVEPFHKAFSAYLFSYKFCVIGGDTIAYIEWPHNKMSWESKSTSWQVIRLSKGSIADFFVPADFIHFK